MTKIDPHKYPGPLEELEKHQGKSSGSQKSVKIGLIAAIIGLIFAGLAAFIISSDIGFDEFIEEGGAAIAVFPFWLFIFIPLFFSKKKSKTSQNKTQISIALVAGLLIIGVAVMIFFINK